MAEHKRRRPLIPLLILLVLALAAGGYFWWRSARATETTGLSASGAVEAQQYQVAAVIPGRVIKVAVSEGDVVKEGQTLVVLDRSALKLQVDQAEQGVKAARRHSATPRRTARKQTSQQHAPGSIKPRRRSSWRRCSLGMPPLPPHSGVVVTVTTNAGQNTSPGKTLLTLTDPSSLFVRVFVPETQIGSVKVGQQATVTPDSRVSLTQAPSASSPQRPSSRLTTWRPKISEPSSCSRSGCGSVTPPVRSRPACRST